MSRYLAIYFTFIKMHLQSPIDFIYRLVYTPFMNMQTNSRGTILDCALRLFSEKGYDGVGINEITAAAGITKPTLYYFFQSKEGVFKAILAEHYARFNGILDQVSVYRPNTQEYYKDIQPVLLAIVTTYFNFALDSPVFYGMVLGYSYAPPTAMTTQLVRPYNMAQYEAIHRVFNDIAATHTNLKDKEERLTRYLIAVINAEIIDWYHGNGALGEEKAKKLIHQFMHGIFA